MTWFSLPAVRSEPPPLFADAEGCKQWLAKQPLANVPLMQAELAASLDSLNTWQVSAHERLKILEALRQAVCTVDAGSARSYAYRPLPLAAVEQKALDAACRLWRLLATGYLHGLRACLDGDPAVAGHGATIAHRVLLNLRREQLCRYRAGAALPGGWWRLLHATLAASEQLGVTTRPVSDRLADETSESTPAAQYAMAVLLHLARPYELSASQCAAAQRWLARWRELATLHDSAAALAGARSVSIDLASDLPLRQGAVAPGRERWLALDGVLGKIKGRLKALRDGRSPEALRLGSGLSAEACSGLLQFLHGALQAPPAAPPILPDGALPVGVASSVDRIYRLLGGRPLLPGDEPTVHSNRRTHEQIAIFGDVVRSENAGSGAGAGVLLDEWRLAAESPGELTLCRAAAGAGERLANRSLLALRLAGRPLLAVIGSLMALEDGVLLAVARLLPGPPQAFTAVGRDKLDGRKVQLAAIFLPALASRNSPASVFVPGGITARLASLDIADLPGGLKPGAIVERGANYERLRCD